VESGFDLVHFGGIFYSYQGSPQGSIFFHFSPLFSEEFIGWVRMGSEDGIIACPCLYSIVFFYIVGMCVVCSIGMCICVGIYIGVLYVFLSFLYVLINFGVLIGITCVISYTIVMCVLCMCLYYMLMCFTI